MVERGLWPDFSRDVLGEVDRLKEAAAALRTCATCAACRGFPSTTTIPGTSTSSRSPRRLPGGAIRIRVAVADVDALVPDGSALDGHARHNTTSVYTAAQIFPMLPERLSTDLTSLNEDEDRAALVADMVIDEGRRALRFRGLPGRRSQPCQARLPTRWARPWRAGRRCRGGRAPRRSSAGSSGCRMRRRRSCAGCGTSAAPWSSRRSSRAPLFDGDQIVDLEVEAKNRARELIEDFMIAANGVTARFLAGKGIASLRRVVRSPERWQRIVKVAEENGERLPAEPDSKALEEFLSRRRRADPLRFPDLSLVIIKLMGAGEYVVERPGQTGRRPLRPGGSRLHALDGAEPALSGPDHAAPPEGRAAGREAALRGGGARAARAALHGDGGRRRQGGAPAAQVGRGAAARAARRPAVRRRRDRRLREGNLGPRLRAARRGQARARVGGPGGRRHACASS